MRKILEGLQTFVGLHLKTCHKSLILQKQGKLEWIYSFLSQIDWNNAVYRSYYEGYHMYDNMIAHHQLLY